MEVCWSSGLLPGCLPLASFTHLGSPTWTLWLAVFPTLGNTAHGPGPGESPSASHTLPLSQHGPNCSISPALHDSTGNGVRPLHPGWPRCSIFGIAFCVSFPGSSTGKESSCNVGDLGSIPGLGRSPGEGKGCPLQYSGLENSMDCIVRGVAKSRTRLSDFHSLTPQCRGLSHLTDHLEHLIISSRH